MDVSKFNLFGENIDVKDAVSREISEKAEKVLHYSAEFLGLGDSAEDNVAILQPLVTAGNVTFDFSDADSVDLEGLLIDGNNVTFKNCSIAGQITIEAKAPNNERINTEFTNCVFTGFVPVTICMGIGIKFTNCRFVNSDISIKISPRGEYPTGTYSHIVEELVVENCTFQFPRIALYSDKGTMTGVLYDYMYLGDIIFSGNTIKVAKETHVSLAALDGGLISNNIMFHYGASSKWKNKKYCIEIKNWSGGAKIIGNSLFESGLEAIKMFNSTSFVISNNVIVQPGQVNLKSAILIYNYGDPNPYLSAYGVISGNMIFTPTKYCVEYENIRNVMSAGNYFHNGGDYSFYYGGDYGNPLPSSITHYAISSVNQDGAKMPYVFTNDKVTFPDFYYTGLDFSGSEMVQYKTLTDAKDFTGASQFNTNFSSPTNVEFSDLPTPVNGAKISITSYNANTTLVASNNLKLLNGQSFTMPSVGKIVLEAMSGAWWEVSRVTYQA